MRTTPSDAKLINLFLDMLAAEQGAGDNTLDAYRRDLTDFSEFLTPTGQGLAGVQTQALSEAPEASPLQRLRSLRLYCLLEVLYATGLRVSELVSLPRSAARRDARMIMVRGKGNKERLVPLNEASRQAMADYLAAMEALRPEQKRSITSSKWLFP